MDALELQWAKTTAGAVRVNDSPTMVISPHIETSGLRISARQAALTILTVTGSIWMLENVDR